ncbi:dihydroxyacetone kinase transcriptional activator DhaS [Paenibacillus chitinolyticus]|uniref:dihydroxyacetone kinase transcriptional activator DhaS n=1 Tax=Paenibacillus chitinolyticus TaxID=79263 RepID=UPI0036641404
MTDSQTTKKALAASLKKQMETKPLAKISVQDISSGSGLNRQTFYYHFKDKYDLVHWIYYSEAVESIADYRDYGHWSDMAVQILHYLMKNRLFYVNALKTPGQNAFDGYLFEATKDMIKRVVDDASGGLDVSDADKSFIAEFYTFAFVGIVVKWVKTGMKELPETMMKRISDLVDGTLTRALSRHAGLQSQPVEAAP